MLLPGYNFFIYMFGEDPAISEKLASGASILLHTNASPAFVKVTVFKATYCEKLVKRTFNKVLKDT